MAYDETHVVCFGGFAAIDGIKRKDQLSKWLDKDLSFAGSLKMK